MFVATLRKDLRFWGEGDLCLSYIYKQTAQKKFERQNQVRIRALLFTFSNLKETQRNLRFFSIKPIIEQIQSSVRVLPFSLRTEDIFKARYPTQHNNAKISIIRTVNKHVKICSRVFLFTLSYRNLFRIYDFCCNAFFKNTDT